MEKQYKYIRPETPITPEVSENIATKIRVLCKKFKDFDEEKRESRASEIHSRLVGAVMIAYGKFKDNDKCSWATTADRAIKWEKSHIVYDFVKRINEENVTVSGDAPVKADDDEAATFHSCREETRDYLGMAIARFDVNEVIDIISRRNPLHATILRLRCDGHSLAEIREILDLPKWELYDIHWPAAAAAMRRFFEV